MMDLRRAKYTDSFYDQANFRKAELAKKGYVKPLTAPNAQERVKNRFSQAKEQFVAISKDNVARRQQTLTRRAPLEAKSVLAGLGSRALGNMARRSNQPSAFHQTNNSPSPYFQTSGNNNPFGMEGGNNNSIYFGQQQQKRRGFK
jgi:hypothetical protein